MEGDTFPEGPRSTIDPDLHEERPTMVGRRWMFIAILALDLLSIAAFVGMVVVPRLT